MEGQPYLVRVLCFLLASVLLVSCTAETPALASVIDTVQGPVPAVDLSRAPVADDPDPSISAGAAADHLDCQYGIWQGMGAIDFGPSASAPNPDQALELFVKEGLFILPRTGFVPTGQDTDRRLYTHSVDGNAKVAVVVADGANAPLDADEGWVVEAVASCDLAELDESIDDRLPWEIWHDVDGNRLPTSMVRTSRGAEHCDWESASFLSIEDRGYIADPRGVLGDIGAATEFEEDVELPTDATDTGYQRDSRRIWLSNDLTIAYIVDGDSVDAWPQATDAPGCA